MIVIITRCVSHDYWSVASCDDCSTSNSLNQCDSKPPCSAV